MEQHPIVPVDGYKLVQEDVHEGWGLAGKAGDKVLAQLAQVPASAGDRVGWLVPVDDGPIIVPNGTTGTVLIRPFTAYRGPITSETTRGLMSAFCTGAVETVPTPLPSSGNHNWYLLYAKISETDAVAQSRLVEDPVTEVVAVQTVNTAHKSVVTLIWVQGTVAATATDPYPAANFPVMPAPAAGEAHLKIGYVHVHYNASPATVTYNVDLIYNEPDLAKVNPQTGAECVGVLGLGRISGTPGNFRASGDVKALATTAGTGINNPVAKRPAMFFETAGGGHKLWIPLSFGGSTAIGANWTVVGGTSGAVMTPDQTAAIFKHAPMGLRNRWFFGRLLVSQQGGVSWANDQDSVAADCFFPSTAKNAALVNPPAMIQGAGNTIRGGSYIDSITVTDLAGAAGDWFLACIFRDVLATGGNDDLALVVRRTTSGGYTAGAMHVIARESGAGPSGAFDGRFAMALLELSPVLFPYDF